MIDLGGLRDPRVVSGSRTIMVTELRGPGTPRPRGFEPVELLGQHGQHRLRAIL